MSLWSERNALPISYKLRVGYVPSGAKHRLENPGKSTSI